MVFKDILNSLIAGNNLDRDTMRTVMDHVMDGKLTGAQIGALLTALSIKGETIDEISAAAASMRQHATRVDGGDGPLVDTCGTGGDGSHTVNISTAAAIVAAAAGCRIAKHGNRSVSSKCGSADVLMALGVNLDLTPEQVGACVREVGIGFLFAPKLHGAMKHAIGPRRELGVRTIFNMLGPLTNPAGAEAQVLGVFAPELTSTLAYVLNSLGSRRALVVHGNDGLDEITTTSTTQVAEVRDGEVTIWEFDPLPYIGSFADSAALKGGDAEENAAILRAVFAGEASKAVTDIVALNAAAAIYVNAQDDLDFGAAVATARDAIASGSATAKLDALVAYSQSA
ncbi:MAG: anthranilate phosphoribosyltransferase [Rhodothermales bacterium]|jgi:anthranilate phosphoribosyltransferase